jgi:hypothetical protein
MDLELIPEQPATVVVAVAAIVDVPVPATDPWWQAGVDETLER